MTNPTTAQIEQARAIAARFANGPIGADNILNGRRDDQDKVQIALAAIIETQEAIAGDSGHPVGDSYTNKMIRRIMNDHAEYMNGVDRGQVWFGYQAVHSMIEAAIAETRAALKGTPDEG